MESQELDKDRLLGEIDPPSALANRTCARIWEALDCEKRDCAPNSSIFFDSAFFSPESILPPSFLLQTSEPDTPESNERERKISKPAKKFEPEEKEDEELPPRSSHWLGLIASVSVGMVIAVFLFPMLEFAKRSTRSYVTESWMAEINRRVDQYEQIHGSTLRSEELQPLNLALTGWQELYSDGVALSLFGDVPTGAHILHETFQERQLLPWEGLEAVNDPIPFETHGLSEHLLLSIPRSWEGTARSAYGRDVLLKDGRVFFRVLPNGEQ